jgi:hypothetical protein
MRAENAYLTGINTTGRRCGHVISPES